MYAKDADSWSTDPANVAAASTSGQALTLQEKKGWRTGAWGPVLDGGRALMPRTPPASTCRAALHRPGAAHALPRIPRLAQRPPPRPNLSHLSPPRAAVWACGWACVGLWALALLTTLKDCASARKNPPAQEPVYAGGPPPGERAAPLPACLPGLCASRAYAALHLRHDAPPACTFQCLVGRPDSTFTHLAGAYAAPVYQTQAPAYPTYQAPGTGAYPAPPPAQPYGGAPPAYGAPAPGAPAGYPPASPFQGADAAPAGYPTNPTV